MALSASCTAICTIVKTRVCCGGPPADPTTALALAFQSMTGSAMATPGNAKATATASSQRLGIGKLEACARTEEGFIRGLLREIQRDGPTSAGGPTGARGTRGKRWWLRKAAGEITGPRGPSAWRVAVQRWTERYLAALFCEVRRLLGPCAGVSAPPIAVRHGGRLRAQRSPRSAAAWYATCSPMKLAMK